MRNILKSWKGILQKIMPSKSPDEIPYSNDISIEEIPPKKLVVVDDELYLVNVFTKNILKGDLKLTLIGGVVEMPVRDLEKIMTALAMQPDLNGVHDGYISTIEKMMVDMAKLIDNKHEVDRFTLGRIISICANEHCTAKATVKRKVIPSRPVTEEDLKGKWRNRGVVDGRHRFCYYAKKYSKESLKTIGWFLTDRDHSTIIHSIQAVKDMMDSDPVYKKETIRIEKLITGGEIKDD